MARKIKIRKIKFGIRFKISIVMIAAIAFASLLVGLAMYNQGEKRIKETMLRLSSAILKGSKEPIQDYLNAKNYLYLKVGNDLTTKEKQPLEKKLKDSYSEIKEYFPLLIKKEKMLDIAFAIDINLTDANTSWEKKNQAKYFYFNRENGTIFNEQWNEGRNDIILKPTLFSYYMQNIDLDPHLMITDLLDDKKYEFLKKRSEDEFVVVGMPIFKHESHTSRSTPEKLYKEYLQLKNESPSTMVEMKSHIEKKKEMMKRFLHRSIKENIKLPCTLHLDTDKKLSFPYKFLAKNYDLKNVKNRDELKTDLQKILIPKIQNDYLTLSDFYSIIKSIKKKYRLTLKKNRTESRSWVSLSYFIKNYDILVLPEKSLTLDDVALISFRNDIAGILGMFLLRNEFFDEMAKNRKEIIDVLLSVLIRAIFITLFFPTFIIRKIARLGEGALELGKGKFDQTIDLSGSDELGRLADIFNVMASNLDKAQKEMLIKERMENELKTAQQIQSALLPEEIPEIQGIEFASYYSAQTESGGDYYDFIPLENNRVGIVIADVSGHGVGSGLVMAMTRTLLHTYCHKSDNTKKIFEAINEYLYENTASNFFVTMFYGVLDISKKTMTYSSAGHNPGLILRKDKLTEITAGGIALGATSNTTFSRLTSVNEIEFQKGDIFLQTTDGIDEAMDKEGNEYGQERLYQELEKNSGKSPQGLVNGVINSVNQFTGNIPQHDDITMITFKIL